jgi:hypothetical protein
VNVLALRFGWLIKSAELRYGTRNIVECYQMIFNEVNSIKPLMQSGFYCNLSIDYSALCVFLHRLIGQILLAYLISETSTLAKKLLYLITCI